MIREFRPLGLGGVFDAFLKVLFTKKSMLLSTIYVMTALPALYVVFRGIVQAFLEFIYSFLGQNASVFTDNPLYGEFNPPPLLIVGLLLLYLFISMLFNLMSCDFFGTRSFERPHSFLSSFRTQVRKVPGHLLFSFFLAIYYMIIYVILSIITAILAMIFVVVGGTSLMIVLWIVFMIVFLALFVAADTFTILIIPAYAIDKQGLFRSIGHALVLTVRNYFRLCGTSLLFRGVGFFGTLVFNLGLSALAEEISKILKASPDQQATVSVITTLIYLVLLILPGQIASNAFNTVLYCNQKVKHEGLGAELLAGRFLEENTKGGQATAT